ncbi:hypothetical protein HB943_08685 [Listeria weihenstephanensis]|uniref:SIR2-like domain-containing protein n=1 Tax=Listeria weihenstephanensis TaxID=1006155 RepID=A0A841Z730_9LIST|nr:SIR2 family protein [Listeria weihenstephanensis]MBC1500679.1 hypothetical protein [Listeria weihenstephanensis]
MFNNFEEKLDYINDAKKNNKLIIFVGAGVSMNSGLPSWKGLIQEFANDLGYKGNIDADILKIPQFYFDSPKYKSQYYSKIEKEIKKKAISNSIHAMIYKLAPKHIITTNYDQLIENTESIEVLTNKYRVVSEDKDFLNAKTDNLIIKMHGDIDNMDSIVLKEDDYLNFSQNKILIETYIKSLMVNHTFIFVGYSIADYNFKQIINWVDSMTRNYDENREYRSKHFMIVDSSQENYLLTQDYLVNKNIFLLPTNSIPSKYKKNSKEKCLDLKNNKGQDLFAVLSYLYDYPVSLKEQIYRICEDMLVQDRISIYDLLRKCNLKPSYYFDFNALGFYEESRSKSINTISMKNFFSMKDKKSKVIQKAFMKAGVKEIYFMKHKTDFHETIKLTRHEFRCSPMHFLELKNNYVDILGKIDQTSLEGAYYHSIIANFEEAKSILNRRVIKFSINKNHFFELVLLKQNQSYLSKMVLGNGKGVLSSDNYRQIYDGSNLNALGIEELKNFYHTTVSNTIEQKEWLAKHIKNYTDIDTYFFGDYTREFKKIQASAYNYYFYMKENHLMLDWFYDPKEFLSTYVKAMLVTYWRKDQPNSLIFGNAPSFDSYTLNLVDINILVKYSDLKTLKNYFNEYKIDFIQIKKNIPVYDFMKNITIAFEKYETRLMREYFQKSMYILSKIKVSKYNINRIIPQILLLLEKQEVHFLHDLLSEFHPFIEAHSKLLTRENKLKVIDFIFTQLVLDEIIKFDKLYIVNHICFEFMNILTKEKKDMIKKEVLCRENIDLYRYTELLFEIEFKQEFLKLTILKLEKLSTYEMLILLDSISRRIIDFNEIVVNKLKVNIDTAINSAIRGYPNWEKEAVERLSVLYMNDFPVDKEDLITYSEYYPNINLVLDTKSCDFENVDINNNLFKEAMNNDSYRKDIIFYGGNIIGEKLQILNKNNRLNQQMQEIYFKYFYQLIN